MHTPHVFFFLSPPLSFFVSVSSNTEKKDQRNHPIEIAKTRLALGLGQLGHCLGPLLENGPKLGGQIFFFFFKYFWEIKKILVYLLFFFFFFFSFFTIKKAQRIK